MAKKFSNLHLWLFGLLVCWSCNAAPRYSNDPRTVVIAMNIDDESTSCQRRMTPMEILILLKQDSCALIRPDVSRIQKSNDDANKLDIPALQSTIINHNNMITYLMNNTVNATYVSKSYIDNHSNTGPILSSWRDWVDLICIACMIGLIIYLCFCRSSNNICDRCSSNIFKFLQTRHEAQEQKQEQQIKAESVRRKPPNNPHTHIYPPLGTISGAQIGFADGYMPD